ncbi:hypothetical protein F383_36994 [Gossypium arboreum]|uniref:Uncharacterized protein n=1 Tax=Gossypium arboreum TaxID=29729 RepID=A0A0B0MAT5_GOSAR|nr:hypothetical protein F383_36994 [Gossypium arboreum]
MYISTQVQLATV